MIIGGDAVPQQTIIANSEVVQTNEAMEWDANGFLAVKTTVASACAGIVVSVARDGVAVDPDSGTSATWTVEGDNQTDKKLYAILDVSPFTLYDADVDVALGTNTGSDLPGYFMDADDISSV